MLLFNVKNKRIASKNKLFVHSKREWIGRTAAQRKCTGGRGREFIWYFQPQCKYISWRGDFGLLYPLCCVMLCWCYRVLLRAATDWNVQEKQSELQISTVPYPYAWSIINDQTKTTTAVAAAKMLYWCQ